MADNMTPPQGIPHIAEWGSVSLDDFVQVRGACAEITNQGWQVRFVWPEVTVSALGGPGSVVYRVLAERWRPLKEGESLPKRDEAPSQIIPVTLEPIH